MNCDNDLIVCIENSNKNNQKTLNKLYEKIFNTVI
jgi:hypothetical protein